MNRGDLLTQLSEVVDNLALARRAYAEACAQEQLHRSTTLRARLSGGEPVTASGHWADIDAATWAAEKLRRRADMDCLIDKRAMIEVLIAHTE